MQSAENLIVGQTQRGAPAAVSQSAATLNERAGVFGHTDLTDTAGEQGVTVTQTNPPGEKPVEQSDAAVMQATEVRPTRLSETLPGGVAAGEQSAAVANLRATRDEDKTKLGDVVSDATAKLPSDKAVTREDAVRGDTNGNEEQSDMTVHPGGVAARPS